MNFKEALRIVFSPKSDDPLLPRIIRRKAWPEGVYAVRSKELIYGKPCLILWVSGIWGQPYLPYNPSGEDISAEDWSSNPDRKESE